MLTVYIHQTIQSLPESSLVATVNTNHTHKLGFLAIILELSGLSLFSTPSPSRGYALCKISFNLFLENQTKNIILFLHLLAVYWLIYTPVSLFKSKPIYISISCIFQEFFSWLSICTYWNDNTPIVPIVISAQSIMALCLNKIKCTPTSLTCS